ncbi:hypothetical protein [Streptomonospora nanhaiensis]|uniref:hypothetical protein n=1 Tax=Streptomonospora nanhaiensis TaxID=1323731 RepID=UPI001C395A25|nr:hypothetical protein [Streptomonospora nanhaiensis]MBV2364981.1 hypothetical protein [Streptomonospora nanhaiensis]
MARWPQHADGHPASALHEEPHVEVALLIGASAPAPLTAHLTPQQARALADVVTRVPDGDPRFAEGLRVAAALTADRLEETS